ncbi:hypothetical protein [Croceicoccus marinus]|uniref:Uncharacterized protein n=1 Tax=Croceicoccus marinus TaxID=450378 RepID=A0A7G6VVC9_9SPHN|nr:hypothetical protein [Croceicoccus marinus]QNE05694.1 hypothetical protein H4O24_03140 [Croceicoccus marinus]
MFNPGSLYESGGDRLRRDRETGCSKKTARANGKADGQVPDHGPVTQDGCKDLHGAAFFGLWFLGRNMVTAYTRGPLKEA